MQENVILKVTTLNTNIAKHAMGDSNVLKAVNILILDGGYSISAIQYHSQMDQIKQQADNTLRMGRGFLYKFPLKSTLNLRFLAYYVPLISNSFMGMNA